MSFPPATEMFQFAGFASLAYGFSQGYRLRGGLPHSEIPGSTIARISPGLFAACHVLHRLSVPRHPPDALTSRLSATPNGKDHSQGPGTRSQAPGRRPARSFPSVRAAKLSFSEDTTGHHANPRACTSRRMPAGRSRFPASVTQLASLQCHINNALRPSQRGCGRGRFRCPLPRRVPVLPEAPPLRVCCANPCRRDRPARLPP